MRKPTALFCIAMMAMLAAGPPSASAVGITAIGIKGGLSVATLHGDLPTDPFVRNRTLLGPGGGVSVTIGLNGLVSLQPELLYAAKGTSLGDIDLTDNAGNPVGTAEVLEAFDYLEIPLLVRIALPTGGLASPYVVAGPAAGRRLSQKLKLTGDASSSGDLDVAKSTDLGLALGGGVEVGRGRIRWSFETRYTLGLTDATRDSYSDNARNGDLLVMAGLAIRR